jgi:hypothetical protein
MRSRLPYPYSDIAWRAILATTARPTPTPTPPARPLPARMAPSYLTPQTRLIR